MATSRGVLGNAWHVVVGETYTAVGGVGSIYFQEAEAVAPVTAFVLLGYLGLVAFFTAVSAATVSTGSHELMSAATNWTNDLYRYYIKPKATAKELLMMTRLSLVGLAGANLAITILWRWLGFTFAAMYNAMGIAFSSAVIPLCLAVWWKKANNDGLFWGTVIGAILGIAYWTWSGFDLGWPCVWANIIVMGVSLIAIPWSWAKPANFDYTQMAKVDIIIHEE
jgi:Na+/proline symporter